MVMGAAAGVILILDHIGTLRFHLIQGVIRHNSTAESLPIAMFPAEHGIAKWVAETDRGLTSQRHFNASTDALHGGKNGASQRGSCNHQWSYRSGSTAH